jgi:Cu/Ag efflux pump CusA
MWIVRLALRRPWSFTVMAILIVLVGIVTIARMSTDIFPDINIPVVTVIWSYPGVAPEVKFLPVDENAPIVDHKENRIHSRQFRSVAISATQIEVTAASRKMQKS